VAAGACDWAIGTDTAGSIRIPASLCGVVGFKPTNGTISSQGVIPLSRSLDAVGALAPDVATAANAVDVMSGGALSAHPSPAKLRFRMGVPQGWVEAGGLDEPTAAAWSHVSAGLTLVPFPSRQEMFRLAEIIQRWEATAFHRRWLETHPQSYGPQVRKRLQAGAKITPTAYAAACRDRSKMRAAVAGAMSGLDALLLPATACVAPTIASAEQVREPLVRFTRPFNLTAQPVFALPAPVSGLPVGIQVIGGFRDDSRLVAVAQALETAWARQPQESPS
jgi:Asp-tRNA(Asn)/Glu-tRNA(Gln) amidotransferase A subunit family amidase